MPHNRLYYSLAVLVGTVIIVMLTAEVPTRSQSIAPAAPPPQAAGYHLAFADEFDSLNLSPTRFGNYTWYDGLWWDGTVAPLSNIWVSNGVLGLVWNSQQGTSDTSISTVSKDGKYHHSFRYGYVEVRMRWDVTTGSWPAIWLLPLQDVTGTSVINGAREAGELDLFEGEGNAPHTFFGTVHNWKNGQDVGHNGNNAYQLPSTVDFAQYHTYGVLWIPGRVTWYLDNQPLFSAPTYPVFDQQDYYLVLSSQAGVNWNHGNRTGVTAPNIGMYVNWVRIWRP